jgi:hypothetical protein
LPAGRAASRAIHARPDSPSDDHRVSSENGVFIVGGEPFFMTVSSESPVFIVGGEPFFMTVFGATPAYSNYPRDKSPVR